MRAAIVAFLMTCPSIASAADVCGVGDKPVDSVIHSVVQDVVRYKQYRAALGASGLIDQFGGKVIAVGTRLDAQPEMLEGTWPENRHAFVIRWPCAAAAKAFWTSERYVKEMIPLRAGAGQFDVALFPAIE